jgi:hypothetical protein
VYLAEVGRPFAAALFRLIGGEANQVKDVAKEVDRAEQLSPSREPDLERWEERRAHLPFDEGRAAERLFASRIKAWLDGSAKPSRTGRPISERTDAFSASRPKPKRGTLRVSEQGRSWHGKRKSASMCSGPRSGFAQGGDLTT